MDRFLYDRDLRHERVEGGELKIGQPSTIIPKQTFK